MNVDFEKLAPFLTNPLVVIGFALFLLFSLFQSLVKAKIIPQVDRDAGAGIVHGILNYGFIIALAIVLLGFLIQGLQNFYRHRENQGTAIQNTLKERANAAFYAVTNEIGSNVLTIGTIISAIEEYKLQPFEQTDKRKVNETEPAYRERVKNYYRDYYSYIQSLLIKFPISDSTWKAHQNDLLTLGDQDLSKLKSIYEHIGWAVDYLQRYIESVQHTVSLNYSDSEAYANITSQRSEKMASVRIELCSAVAAIALLARSDEELMKFRLGLASAKIDNVPVIRGQEGAKLLMTKAADFSKEKVKAIGSRIVKIDDTARQSISNTIHDPYLKLLTFGASFGFIG